jgi:hypothetical protein
MCGRIEHVFDSASGFQVGDIVISIDGVEGGLRVFAATWAVDSTSCSLTRPESLSTRPNAGDRQLQEVARPKTSFGWNNGA